MVYTDHHLRQLARYLSYDNCLKSRFSFNHVNFLKYVIESSCFQSLSLLRSNEKRAKIVFLQFPLLRSPFLTAKAKGIIMQALEKSRTKNKNT